MIKATLSQQKAMQTSKGNFLVSASAGSGKTATLTERVFRSIIEGTKLDELLVLTFTNLAAAEMRDRIRKKLIDENKPELFKLASALDAANIQTYDAYALNIVKKYYYTIGLNKDISLVDQTLLELEERKIIDQIFFEAFDKKDERYLKLIDDYCLKNNDELKDYILRVSHTFDLKENKEEYLKAYVSKFFCKDKIKNDVDELVNDIKNNIYKFITRIKKFENADYASVAVDALERIAASKDYDELKANLSSEENALPNQRKSIYNLKDYPNDSAYHEFYKKQLDKYKSILSFDSFDELLNQYLGIKDNVQTIIDIVLELDTRLNNFKKKYNVFSFKDIFAFAMKIISIPEINKEIKSKYKYIMIDEYQDTSDIQEKFVEKIANNNVYVVGDVKQSIYRFRNANCDLFLDKFNRYGRGEGGVRIELPDNFRSRKEVIELVNNVFSPLMNKENTGLDYQKEHLMLHGNKSYLSANCSYNAEILNYSLGEKYLNYEHEARLIATDIAKKMRDGFEVYDKEKNELRKVKYSDFAILMYAKSNFSTYQKVFNEYQIPLFATYDKSIRDNNLTMTFENLISLLYLYSIETIEHSKKFLHSFISVLRSFLFECDDQSIENLVYSKNYKDFTLFDLIKKTYEETKEENLKVKISKLISNFDIYSKLIKIGDISNNTSLLEYYYSIASQMDDMGYSLEDFKKYFDDLKEFEIDPEYSPSDDVDDCVKLLSIHASKGLQFKICYFAQLYKQFNVKSFTAKCLADPIYGIDIPNVYNKNISSIYHSLIFQKEKRESLVEQLRVFYVALTRAEEKIILLHNVDDRKKPINEFAQCNRFFDFISVSNAQIDSYTEEIELIKRVDEEEKQLDGVISIANPVTLSSEVKENRHASKELDDDIDEELLLLGKKYHYYLELVNFNTLDTSFIKDKNDKKRIDKFLSNNLFKNMKDANVMHEYPFYDEESNVHGIIDLLVEHSDHIDIIDFKLSHIDDDAYEKQLGVYKQYVSKLTNKKINTFVTGILSGEIKQIN